MGGDDEYIYAEQRIKEIFAERESSEKDKDDKDKDPHQLHVVSIFEHFISNFVNAFQELFLILHTYFIKGQTENEYDFRALKS